ncbi:MAG: Abi family protein, partial [Bacteroidaceae bacterium]|nr:Abi family protein [Bacteroidaceae bacterium]
SNPYPPAWILSEILPFGIITNIYSNIKDKKIKKRVSQAFGLQIEPFESWLTIVTLTRNSCCHHARVWNKQNTIRATIPNRINRPWITLSTDSLRIFLNICIIKYFLDIVSPGNDMLAKLQWLFVKFPEVDLKALGFPNGWEMEPLWKA